MPPEPRRQDGPSEPARRKSLLPRPATQAEGAPDLFQRLLETSPDAVLVVNEAGTILFANLQAEALFEYPSDTLVGTNVDGLVPGRMRPSYAIHRQHYAAAPRLRPMGAGLTLFGQKRGGSEFPVEISLSSIKVDNQLLSSANIGDITERQGGERKMRRMHGQLLCDVESIQGAFAILDKNDRLVLCNSSYRHVIGRALPGELVGRSFQELITASVASGAFSLAEQGASDLIE